MFQGIFKIAGILVLAIFMVATLAFTTHESSDVVCREIEINFADDELIQVDKDELIRIVKSADKDILSKKLKEVNTEAIELSVEKHQAVLNAEVFEMITNDSSMYKGVLVVKVKHREPVVRIMSDAGNYYLDEFGGRIPISSHYSANVLATTGYFSEKYAINDLLPFILYLENDEFWKAQIEQVHIEKNGEMLLTPLVGEHIIEFGTVDDYQVKLLKMKAFYEQVLAKNNWNKYKTVSLKYKDQVIAKKR